MLSVMMRSLQVIKWLGANGGGRATFLPLNKISASRAQGRALMVPEILELLDSLMTYWIMMKKSRKLYASPVETR